MTENVNEPGKSVRPGEIRLLSRLKSIFPVELLIELEVLSMNYSIESNSKTVIIERLFRKYNIKSSPLGPGTNRYAVITGEYCVKIALDRDGKTDNMREFTYSKSLQPYALKAYEIYPSGLVAVFEYVQVFSLNDLIRQKSKMREILKIISHSYLIGDIGIVDKNYTNWGYRLDGSNQVVILDFAYIYNLTVNVFKCSKCGGILSYDESDYNSLKCPKVECGRVYSFWDIRKRIPREMELKEIGDMKEKGYLLHYPEEIQPVNPKFTYVPGAKKKNKDEIPKEFRTKKDPCHMNYSNEDQPKSSEDAWNMYLEYLRKESEEEENVKEKERETRI